MSIVGRRKRSMVLAWFGGVITVSVIIGVLMILSIFDLMAYLSFESLEKEVPVVETTLQVVAARPIALGTVLGEDDVKEISVPLVDAVTNNLALVDLVGKEIQIDIDENLAITLPMITKWADFSDEQRVYEFDYVKLPYKLDIGDVIDVRIVFPNGQDYVVLAKKEVIDYERESENVQEGLLSLLVEEEEVLRMSSALVDAILTETAELYTVKYIDPKVQVAALISYPVNRSVLSILEKNPNLLRLPNLMELTNNRALLDQALKELLDEDDEWFSMFSAVEIEDLDEASQMTMEENPKEEALIQETITQKGGIKQEDVKKEEVKKEEIKATGSGMSGF